MSDRGYKFSIAYYNDLCESITHKNCTIVSYLESHTPVMLLRHDVDRKEKKALDLARVENEHGISASYYFRKSTFNIDLCDKISAMGHEIGFHYESLSESKGDYELAIDSFTNDLNKMRENFDVKTICMHGSPLSKYDNRFLWGRYDYRDFGIIGDASLDVDDSYLYITDTGGSWNSKYNVRDKMKEDNVQVDSDTGPIQLITDGRNIYLNTHPERWSDNSWEHLIIIAKDGIFNLGKLALKTIRR